MNAANRIVASAPAARLLRLAPSDQPEATLTGEVVLASAQAAEPAAHPLTEAAKAPAGTRAWRVCADDDVLAHAERLRAAVRIDVQFDKFTDGRGFSSARLLRERLRYRGALRAVGDVVIDTLFYLRRCGFDEFALRPDQDLGAALAALSSFSAVYQAASDGARPIAGLRLPTAKAGAAATANMQGGV